MPYFKETPKEFLQLDPEDWTIEEWKTICKLFLEESRSEEIETIKVTMSSLEWFTVE